MEQPDGSHAGAAPCAREVAELAFMTVCGELLQQIDTLPTPDHVAVLEEIHRRLHQALVEVERS